MKDLLDNITRCIAELDGDYQGNTKSLLNGVILQDIRPGEHKIKAVKDGYLPIFKNFDLNK